MQNRETDYEKYIRTTELLQLQKVEGELCCDDELTFQTVHQISELHFKLILQHLRLAKSALIVGEKRTASRQLHRANIHLLHLPTVFKILEQMEPTHYHTIRLALGSGSGQDSPGFNQILQEGPQLWEPFDQLLTTHFISLLEIHQQPDKHRDFFDLIQELINFDQNFQNFRYQHFMLVRRMIGIQTTSLKGVPANQLQRGVRQEFFPELWQAICDQTAAAGSSYSASTS
ncbi:tryptophan 2,3-dioxygenase [Tumebacillus algifaecis]|uniref:Tryptophan 2,3-dioxygenase n=1 Tax=Tumebacillus algifaecis TaxID=1214604 RepID=A0A223D1V3_9BACL|nr:tryptophan 2,3-dioxygenase family protein [Tumebacillus algifaecis]ASS75354.1 tryptophan 2,3-dioxygenase [Tumebacillus algifaecis]